MPGTDAPPPGCSGRGNPNSICTEAERERGGGTEGQKGLDIRPRLNGTQFRLLVHSMMEEVFNTVC